MCLNECLGWVGEYEDESALECLVYRAFLSKLLRDVLRIKKKSFKIQKDGRGKKAKEGEGEACLR